MPSFPTCLSRPFGWKKCTRPAWHEGPCAHAPTWWMALLLRARDRLLGG